jgi:hypothetical protein
LVGKLKVLKISAALAHAAWVLSLTTQWVSEPLVHAEMAYLLQLPEALTRFMAPNASRQRSTRFV